jgi:C1A family cysteine protease
VIVALVVASVVAVPTNQMHRATPRNLDAFEATFAAWKVTHNKEYESEWEHGRRLAIFVENAGFVERHNSEGHSWTMGLNQFADLTSEEFLSLNTLKGASNHSRANIYEADDVDANPASVDWRDHNLVNPVKNQGQCGSCWAFSTVVSLEGQLAKKSGNLVSFSEQDLVDCVKDVVLPGDSQKCCDGCQGGLMDYAFEYMIASQDGRDDTESSYPYSGRDGSCNFAGSSTSTPIKGYSDVKSGDESALESAVANIGPISVAVNANMFWQLYSGGILDPWFCSGSSLDHGVAVVGYGTEGTKDYWIVRNSWGETWGEHGYVRLAKGKNTCGVANQASFPTV